MRKRARLLLTLDYRMEPRPGAGASPTGLPAFSAACNPWDLEDDHCNQPLQLLPKAWRHHFSSRRFLPQTWSLPFSEAHLGELECRFCVKFAAEVLSALLRQIQHRHWYVRPVPPSLPSSSCTFFANRAPSSSRNWLVYHVRQKHIVVCFWPHANAIPDRSLAFLDARALSQLRLHNSFRVVKALSTPDVEQVFDEHLTASGFPHLCHAQ